MKWCGSCYYCEGFEPSDYEQCENKEITIPLWQKHHEEKEENCPYWKGRFIKD